MQCLEISRCRPFADQDLHPVLNFLQCFLKGKTFVIGADARIDVLFCIRPSETWCMSVYRLIVFFCQRYFASLNNRGSNFASCSESASHCFAKSSPPV